MWPGPRSGSTSAGAAMRTTWFVCLALVFAGCVAAVGQKNAGPKYVLGPEWKDEGWWFRRPIDAKALRASDDALFTTYLLTTLGTKREVTVIESDDGRQLRMRVRPKEGAPAEVLTVAGAKTKRAAVNPPPPVLNPPPLEVGCSVERDEKGRAIKFAIGINDYDYIDLNGDGKIDVIVNSKTRARQIVVGDRLIQVEEALEDLPPPALGAGGYWLVKVENAPNAPVTYTVRSLDAGHLGYEFVDGVWRVRSAKAQPLALPRGEIVRGPRPPGGLLDYAIGEYLTIEGVRVEESGFGITERTLQVDTVNGKMLPKPVRIEVWGVELPSKQRCVLKGYETGQMAGDPPAYTQAVWAKDLDPKDAPGTVQVGWGWYTHFIVLVAVEPKGLKVTPVK